MAQIVLTRDQYLDSIRQLTAAADAFAARLDLDQLTWQPAAGERWSILECLDHIVVSTELYLDAMDLVKGDAKRSAAADLLKPGGPLAAWFLARMEPPPSKKVSAPGRFHPRPTLHPEQILPQFRKTMARVASLLESAAGRDLNSVRFRNPLLSVIRFTVGGGFLIIAAHGRRHLWQAEQVTKEPDFPAAK